MSSSIIYLGILFFSFLSLAQISKAIQACPEDSICSPQLGEKFLDWNTKWTSAKSAQQKNKIIKTLGLPVSFYSELNSDHEKQFASWHSKCEMHKKKNIYQSLGFIKKINNDDRKMFQPIYIKQRTKDWNLYYVPIDFSLIQVKNSELVGFIEREGKFIPLSIDKAGNLKLLSKLPHNSFQILEDQERVKCPVDVDKIDKHSKYYLDRYCHYLKSDLQTTRLIALRYWSCP